MRWNGGDVHGQSEFFRWDGLRIRSFRILAVKIEERIKSLSWKNPCLLWHLTPIYAFEMVHGYSPSCNVNYRLTCYSPMGQCVWGSYRFISPLPNLFSLFGTHVGLSFVGTQYGPSCNTWYMHPQSKD